MKRFWKVLITMILAASLTACGATTATENVASENQKVETESTEAHGEKAEIENDLSGIITDAGVEELEQIVSSDMDNTIAALEEEYEQLMIAVDTYERYVENLEKVEEYYEKVYSETQSLCIRLREYSVSFAGEIIASDKSTDDKYEDLDVIYDCIYEDARDEIYDEIYNGICDDLYDDLYNGVVKDGYDVAEYKEWSDASSKEYKRWSDLSSDVYEEWSDCGSEIYDFWSDVKGEVWDEDAEKVQEKINEFVEDIEKLKDKGADTVEDSTESAGESEVASVSQQESTVEEIVEKSEETDENLVDGMRPEFKEAMDSYEAFYADYCGVLEKYSANPTDMSLLTEYTELMQKSAEVNEKFEAWDEGEMNEAELKYYIEVNGRVSQMLLEIG